MGIRSWWRDTMGLATPEVSTVERAEPALAFQTWVDYLRYGGNAYQLGIQQTQYGNTEQVGQGFAAYVNGAMKANGIVFACMATRLMLFTEARFMFRELGRNGNLFGGTDRRSPGNRDLELLRAPWPGGTTGDLLAHMIQDVDVGGNAFIYRDGRRLHRLRPDWTTLVYGSPMENGTPWDLDANLLGYLYTPGGPGQGRDPVKLPAESVAHWAPIPDPLSPRRGMSWITPILREIDGDNAANDHKVAFFGNGATVNLTITYDPAMTKEMFEYAVEAFKGSHEGPENAYKTLHLLGGEAKALGANFEQMDFKAVQGAAETRIAAASGVHPVVVALSEGLQGSSLNAGNFNAARRITADKTLWPLWRQMCGALSWIVTTPTDSELWIDDTGIAFLREDEKDRADIQETQARTAKTLVEAGYTPESAAVFIASGDPNDLDHSGMVSVQLHDPNEKPTQPELPGIGNGKVPPELAPAKAEG